MHSLTEIGADTEYACSTAGPDQSAAGLTASSAQLAYSCRSIVATRRPSLGAILRAFSATVVLLLSATAARAAKIYSIVATCHQQGLDPFAYLRDVIDRLPRGHDPAMLTPAAWKAEQLDRTTAAS